MLTLILGRGKSGKTTELLRAVKDCTAVGMARRILIVPEQLSHQTERRLSAMCGDEISYVSEVLSFTRLASRVFSLYGGGARQSLDQGGRILTARLALDSIRSQLKVFASAAGKAEFLSSVVSILDEFKTYAVTARQLMEASGQTEGLFAEKLRELSLILGAYEAAVAQGTCDPRDKLWLLRRKLAEYDYAVGRHFFVDGFTDFSQQEQNILEVLLRKSEHVTVTLPCDGLENDSSLFAPGRETALRLLRMAKSMGQSAEVRRTDYQRELPPELTYLEKTIFTYEAPAFNGNCKGITLVSAADRLEECRHCAAVLRRGAMEGLRWRDMAVAAGNTSVYGAMMEAVCREYGIPLYTGIKRPVAAHPAAAFLLCALEAAAEGMETETVMAYLRTGYSGVSRDDCDALENYAYVWTVRGSKWQKEWTEHPDGYDGRFTEDTAAQLARLNRIRQQAVGPLLRLSARLRAAGNTRGQMEAVYGFLEETKLSDQVAEALEALTAAGEQESAQESAQVFNTLMECLQQTVSVLGKTSQSSGELLRVLRLALGQYELGTIPATLDSVSFGAVDAVRGIEPKLLYVLGTNEGMIPGTVGSGSLLTEQERNLLLNELHIALAPDSEGALQREILQIYGAFSAPRERLYVSYAETDEGEQLQPSFLVERLQAIYPQMGRESVPQYEMDAMTTESITELYLTMEQEDSAPLQESIRRAAQQTPELEQRIIDARAAALPRQTQVSAALTARLFGSPVALTASRLDELGNCPLRFFLNYGLKARARKEASFDAAEFGTFLHYILEQTVGNLTRTAHTLPLSPGESAALVSIHMEPYLESRLRDAGELPARQRYLYDRGQEEASALLTEISQEFSQSAFRPCAFELQFGVGKDLQPLLVEGKLGKGHLDGMVDRVDLWQGPAGDYLRIVDYKSGTKKFDYTDLTGGVGMQMLLYLFALETSGIAGITEHPTPAGALYFPAKRGILNVDEPVEGDALERLRKREHAKRTGLVLADEAVLEAMEPGVEGRYIPVQKKKSGLGDYAVTPEQMKLLKDYVTKRMGQAVDRILEGEFAPEPFYRGPSHDPCAWCDYGDVCQKDEKFRREHYVPPVKAADFWKLIGGGEDG